MRITWHLDIPVLVPVHDAGRKVVDICACADQQQDDEQEGFEVEERRLDRNNNKLANPITFLLQGALFHQGPERISPF